ncbi:MAG: hypothetical protein KC645_18525 [Gemmatimonadetes bacterium]|nr:hypothetical protein [Gemmatimonadota bacterium]
MSALLATVGLIATLGVAPLSAQQSTNAPAVTVQNDFPDAVTVFLEHGMFDRRLGVVDGLSTRTLSLPPWLVGHNADVRLFVVRKSGEELASQDFAFEPGHPVAMIVPAPAPAEAVEYAELPMEELARTTLTVTNDRDADVVVYAQEREVFDIRLGTVPAHSVKTLDLPDSAVRDDQSVRVVVHPLRGFDLESYPLQIQRREHLALRLSPKA